MLCRFAGIGERRQGLAVEFLVNKRACALRLLRDTGIRTTGPFRAAYICLYAVLQPGVVGVGCLEKRFVIPGGPAVRITPPPAVSQLRLDFLALSTAGRTRPRDDRVPRVSPE